MTKKLEKIAKKIAEHPDFDKQIRVGVPLARTLLCNVAIDNICDLQKQVIDLLNKGKIKEASKVFSEFKAWNSIAVGSECNIACPRPKVTFERKEKKE